MYSLARTSARAALNTRQALNFAKAAGLRTAARLQEPADARTVNVTSFAQGARTSESIKVADGPVSGLPEDEIITAKPLDPKIGEQLTATMSKFTLFGKVAVVTGGGRGLGYNMAQALCEVGIRGVAIFDVQQELGDKAAQDLCDQTGVDVRFYKVDVRDEHAISHAVKDVAAHYGRIDCLISAAGIADSNIKAENYDSEKFRRLLDINITGSFLVAQAVGRHMISSGNGGSVVFIASMSGSIVNYPQEQSCYNASKAAVVQLTKSLAAEWARYKIRVNAISPGYMDTALNRVPALEAQKRIWIDNTPQKRLGAVDDLNNLAVYLASPGSSYMTGNNCLIDGGYTLW